MRDHEYLDLSILPKYNLSAFRYFMPHEHHIARQCPDDVLLMVLDGVLRFEEDGREIELKKGQWYIQHANSFQTGQRESDCPHYYYVHFFGVYTRNPVGSLSCTGEFDPQQLMPLLKSMDYFANKQSHNILEKHVSFFRILIHLSDIDKSIRPNSSLCMSIAEYIDIHFADPISLSCLEQEFFYSRDYIIRIFKEFYGVTPYQYITMLRIGRAKNLLISTERYMTDIARDCGYHDVTSFYRAFVKQTGQTPKEWLEKRNIATSRGIRHSSKRKAEAVRKKARFVGRREGPSEAGGPEPDGALEDDSERR